MLADSKKKIKNKEWRDVMNEINNLLVWKNKKDSNNFRKTGNNSKIQEIKSQKKLYKKTINIPIETLTTGDFKTLEIAPSVIIYIYDREKYNYYIWKNIEIITNILIYYIYEESSTVTMKNLMSSSTFKERVDRKSKSDLYSMWIDKVDLNLNIKRTIQDSNSLKSYLSVDSKDDYAKQITDELMWSIWTIEKDIENTARDIEKDMDEFVKKLSS